MKLRLRADTLRLRLSRTDLALFDEASSLEASTRFPGGARLIYRLERRASDSPSPEAFTASFEAGVVVVGMPALEAAAWVSSDQVSVRGTVALDDGKILELLIEKDFACLTEDRPEDKDAFPHPHDSCGK